jgi:hypothetical protein
MKRPLEYLALALWCAVLSEGTGCATYSTPTTADRATVSTVNKSLHITQIDEMPLSIWDSDPPGVYEAYVAPGKHTIRLQLGYSCGTHYHASLWFVASSKGKYLATYRVNKSGDALIWMTDAITGGITGGIRGSDDEPRDTAPQTQKK